jgi:catechol 2,3-dioxygenase-like lactoylglutathione lyase family enzyme
MGRYSMGWRLEAVSIPASDVDRAKTFYVEKVGFNVDLDVNADGDPRVRGAGATPTPTPPPEPRSH